MNNVERFSKLLFALKQMEKDDAPAKKFGLSPTHIRILEFLYENELAGSAENSTISRLAVYLELSAPSLSVAVTQLEQKAFVLRKKSVTADSRIVVLYLSHAGTKLYLDIDAYRRKKAEKTLSPLTLKEQEELISLLEKITKVY